MKASFIILPALLMSAATQRKGGGKSVREKDAGSAQALPACVPKRGWFDWARTWRTAAKKPNAAG